MPSNKPVIMIRTTTDIINKFKVICKEENRSMSNQAEKLILDMIRAYKQENGKSRLTKLIEWYLRP